MNTDARLERLEAEVEALRKAIGLLVVSAQPAVTWLDSAFAALNSPGSEQ